LCLVRQSQNSVTSLPDSGGVTYISPVVEDLVEDLGKSASLPSIPEGCNNALSNGKRKDLSRTVEVYDSLLCLVSCVLCLVFWIGFAPFFHAERERSRVITI
jgi:hypothetical protein